MRSSKKKLTIAVIVIIVIWSFAFFFPEVPRTSLYRPLIKAADVEVKLDSLLREVELQNREIEKLKYVVDKFDTADSNVKEVVDKNEVWSAEGEVKSGRPPVLPVLVISCDRITVRRCIENLIKFRPSKETFPIVVSQDCGHNQTYHVIKRFVDADPSIAVVRQPDQSFIPLPSSKVKFRGYYKIARHFKFALNHMFKTLGHEAVIIVEDDLDISPDFFEYFQGTYPLLLQDPSIWCVSAWNDNGKRNLIDKNHPELLYRTDFFPGLGWLLRKEMWMEFEPQWPEAFFDDWLRDPRITKGKSCIRPEISRTYSFGKVGVSRGLFFDRHLAHIQLNSQFVEFTKLNLTYLLKLDYDETFSKLVSDAEPLEAEEVMRLPPVPVEDQGTTRALRVSYLDARSFQKAAKKLGLMDDFRSGIPRTAYNGVVTCFINGRRVYLAPGFVWTGYDPTWG